VGIHLLSAAFVFIWATGFIVARYASGHADPLAFLAIRHVLSIGVFVTACFVVKATWPRSPRAWIDAMVAGILMHGFYLGGVFWAVRHGMPAGITALVTGLHPVFTAALAIPILHEHVSPWQWAGIALGLAGVGLIVAPALGTVEGVTMTGLAAALFATVSFTLGTIWQKRSRPAADLRVNAAIQYIGALLVMGPAAFLLGDLQFDNSLAVWGAMAWAVLMLSVGAISILLVLLKRGAASRVAPLVYLAPPVAALLAFILFGERLAGIQVAGMVLAVAGAFAAGSFRRT
jgi:drug/metabolite transporter (DMT)-like permease